MTHLAPLLRYWSHAAPWQQALVVFVVLSWAAIILCLALDWWDARRRTGGQQ